MTFSNFNEIATSQLGHTFQITVINVKKIQSPSFKKFEKVFFAQECKAYFSTVESTPALLGGWRCGKTNLWAADRNPPTLFNVHFSSLAKAWANVEWKIILMTQHKTSIWFHLILLSDLYFKLLSVIEILITTMKQQ